MPRRNGTGPMGAGAKTGRGLGLCTGRDGAGFGMGRGLVCRRGFGGGFGRGYAINQDSGKTNKNFLQEQKELLQSRLEAIDEQLEDEANN